MVKFHILGFVLLGSIALLAPTSCKREPPHHQAKPNNPDNQQRTSQKLLLDFPLLALIEKPLWGELLKHEFIATDTQTSDLNRAHALKEVKEIAVRLQELHPFTRSDDTITLGGFSYHRKTGEIELMATVNDLKARQKGDQEDIELILCSQKGRSHESLFVTNARPLHLEILLHLTGHSKDDPPSRFHVLVSIPNHAAIKVDKLLTSKDREPLPHPLLWEFSGSSFDGLYQPDLTGDLIICWHAHDSVLRITDHKIARNETRLFAKQHPRLKPNLGVKIILIPVPQGK